MKIKKNSVNWNLGDTSFRRKKTLEDYLELTKVLYDQNKKGVEWDKKGQTDFYLDVLEKTSLLEDSKVRADFDKRGRTMTNAIVKLGLADYNRKITGVGKTLINIDEQKKDYSIDLIEKNLGISDKNILFLRQLLKIRIFDFTESQNFNPFIIMILFFIEYGYLEEEHFKYIVQSLFFNQDYKEIVKNYRHVRDGNISFIDYYEKYLDVNEIQDNMFLENKKLYIENGINFREVFTNRKTSSSIDKYEKFYNSLLNIRAEIRNSNVTKKTIKKLLDSLRCSVTKKAFMTNIIFEIPVKSSNDYKKFWDSNKKNKLFYLEDKTFRKKLYEIFKTAKKQDLIKEYYDITVRTFNLSGIVSFRNGRVRLSKKYLKDLLTYYKDKLYEIIEFKDYKSSEDYLDIFHDEKKSTVDILSINDLEIKRYNQILKEKNKMLTDEDLRNYYLNLEEKQFKKFIDENFPNKKIVEILNNIKLRNDQKVYDMVTDSATIPTIFEYIIGIAWYKISKKYYDYEVLNSLNLSLDGSYLPLTHASGGQGDIVIKYKDHILMLEVTLMNLNNQRRMELEPVIRHTTNLTIKNKEKLVYTIFIANEIDNNLSNIFRICSFLDLESSMNKDLKTKNGVKITSMMIDEIIKFIELDVDYKDIYENIRKEFVNDKQDLIKSNWREELMDNIL